MTVASAGVEIVPETGGFGRALTSRLGGQVTSAGQSLGGSFGKVFGAAAGVGIGAAVTTGVGAALQQEADTDRISAALGANEKQSARLGKIAGRLYGNAFGDSLGSVNTALEAVRSSFRDIGTGRELRKATRQALIFSDVFQLDLPKSVSVAQNIVKTGLAKNATEALDLLTASAQRVPAALRENILDAADEYGGFFKTVGLDGEQAFSTLVKASAQGQYGIDKAGDAIKEFTIRATDMSTTSQDAYKILGLDARASADAILRGGDDASRATQKIVDGLLGIKSESKQANTAIALFGTPLEDLGVKNIPAFLEGLDKGGRGLGDFAGATDRAGKVASDNAATRLESFKRKITQTFVDLLGGTVVPLLTGKVIPFLERLAGAFRANLQPAVDKIADVFDEHLRPVLERVGDFMRDNPAVVKAFAITLGILAAAIGVVTLATTAFSIALNTTGIPLVVIAIAALVAGLVYAYQRSEQFRSIVDQIGASIRSFAAFVQAKVVPVIVDLAGKVRDNLQPIFTQLGETFRNDVLPLVAKLVAKFRENQPAIQRVMLAVVKLQAGVIDLGTKIAGKVIPVLIRFVGFLIRNVVPGLVEFVRGVAEAIRKAVDFGRKVLDAARDAVEFAKKVKAKIAEVITAIKELPGKAKGALGNLKDDLEQAGKDLVQGLINGVEKKARDLITAAENVVGDAISAAKSKLGIKSPSRVFRKIGDQTMEGLLKGLEGGRRKVVAAMIKTVEQLRDQFNSIKSSMRSLAQSIADSFRPDLFAGSLGDLFAVGSSGVGDLTSLKQALTRLKGFGLGDKFISDLFASGNTSLILELAGSDKATAKAAQSLFNQTNSLASGLGTKVGRNDFGDELGRLGDRLEVALAKLEKAVKKSGKDFGDKVNRAATDSRR